MIRWDEPIEAYHEDGRVVPMTIRRAPARNGTYVTADAPDKETSNEFWNEDGSDRCCLGQWRIRNIAQAPETPHPAPSPSEVGLEVVDVEKPAYVPAHKLPCWLSSEDVKAEIMKLAENGADKAVCWDMMQAVYRLADRALEKEAGR